MRISRIAIRNFRNFRRLKLRLGKSAVIVGENKVGKSNLLHALRLVLDPSLPDTARQLRLEDFWDGLTRPLSKENEILISIDLADFEEDERHLALLAEHLVKPDPMVARLTYVFRPRATLEGPPATPADYEFLVYGGDRPENTVGYDLRGRLPLSVLQALRDAETDLAQWTKSPLKPLLEAAGAKIERTELVAIADEVQAANARISESTHIREIENLITARLDDMVGEGHSTDTTLGVSPTDPDRLIRSLRLFIDSGQPERDRRGEPGHHESPLPHTQAARIDSSCGRRNARPHVPCDRRARSPSTSAPSTARVP